MLNSFKLFKSTKLKQYNLVARVNDYCVFVFVLFLFASALDLLLNSNSVYVQFQVSVFVGVFVLAAGRLCVCNAWGGPLPSVSPAIPSQPADETGPFSS